MTVEEAREQHLRAILDAIVRPQEMGTASDMIKNQEEASRPFGYPSDLIDQPKWINWVE